VIYYKPAVAVLGFVNYIYC